MIAALILASGARPAGRASPAGSASAAFARLAGQWLALRSAGLDPLRIAIGKEEAALASGFGLSRENFVLDRSRTRNAFSGLQAGLEALLAADDWSAVIVQPVASSPPHPSLVLALVERFAEGDAAAVVPSHRRRRGFPVLLARTTAEALLDLDARQARVDEVLASLEEVGAAVRLEAYTDEVLPPRPRRRAPARRRG
jgi:CTP:molybdopterin cytidylyltransferase MocA